MTPYGTPPSVGPGWPSAGWPPAPPSWPAPPAPAAPPYPPYPPGLFPPPPPPAKKSPGLAIIGGVAFVCMVAFFGFALANYLNAATPPSATPTPVPPPTPEPSYHQVTEVPDPDLDPSDLPEPTDTRQAQQWSKANKLYTQSVPVPTACTLKLVDMSKVPAATYQAHLNEVMACVWGVWHDPVTAAGYELPRPPVTVYSKPIKTPCGTMETQNAFYCSGNQRIYFANDFDINFSRELRGQPFVAELILAHEFGHDVQGRTGIFFATITLEQASKVRLATEYNRRLELQADCFAGHWLGAVAASTNLSDRDRQHLATAAEEIGMPQPDPDDDHGSSDSRRNWLLTGMQNATIASCNTFTAASVKVR